MTARRQRTPSAPVGVAAATARCQPRPSRRSAAHRVVTTAADAASSEAPAAQQVQLFAETVPQRVVTPEGKLAELPGTAGVYAVYNSTGNLQYLGLSRKIAVSLSTHRESLPEGTVHSAKILELPNAAKEQLQEAWKQWMQEAVAELGAIPPGNAPGETSWQQRRPRAAKAEVRLTPGKGVQDLTCTMEELLDQVVKGCKVVAFVKGTRTQPQCGFSYKVLTILQESGAEFEVVNVLDEIYNPGLREAIKAYSAWPTIPQVYVGGEFIGGADIVEEMHGTGDLKATLVQAGALRG
ncbi:hypothetical protein D9Q98_000043 [Chlorella vulgaris]|uniref:Glutaredoxin domain-containing protein n=1 Tax=Chlorella vulgaris TaxID=3077 RepID=A0A9D4Z193_CHLVU|nr:hypothetical protein D9Q98_000043 [Chlorella vulgaris]